MVLEWVDRMPMMINAEHCDPHPSFFFFFDLVYAMTI